MKTTEESGLSHRPILRIRDLEVEKSGRPICRLPGLKVSENECVLVTGPNGSGKSTLLRVLAGLEPDYQGAMEIDASALERTLVHQSPFIFRGSVLSNVEYGLKARRVSARLRRAKSMQMLEAFGIGKLCNENATQLSGGEKKRVAIARAMVFEPRILFLDEPFAELDAVGTDCLIQQLGGMSSTVFITSPEKRAKVPGYSQHIELMSPQCDVLPVGGMGLS